ncbi:M56 family metallopeptidase [Clostridium sp. Marseille-P2415]|uniref:M56 family metallopeptidase n=1 Tax=Clostridium sp. Marseille-P2415 TaxID=1805471 RepID=UPI0009888E25|nr:M56 family metallopeptidase [Clostridium sp. Marseille-P2415]
MSLLKMSFSTTILILAIVVIRALLLYKLPKKTFLVLWGVVLYHLLIPFSIPSKFSIFTVVDNLRNQIYKEDLPLTGTPIPFNGTIIASTVSISPDSASVSISPILILWIVGSFVCALCFIITHLRCRREYKTALPLDNEFVKDWQQKHLTRRRVKIQQLDKISTPLTYGIFRPVVLLPKQTDWTDETRLNYILMHEFVHIRRFDILTKLLMATALCIHWFNPFVWLMYILANRDIELSCDESVVRTFGVNMKSAYALTLIGLEEKKSRLTPLVNSFSKNAIEERIVSIMKMKKTSFVGILLALTLVIGTTTVFATSALAINNESKDKLINNSLMSQAEVIDSENRNLIGTSVQDNSTPFQSAHTPNTTSNNINNDADLSVPENSLVNKLASQDMLSPSSITEFEATDNITPEIIMPNGSAAIFSENDHQGWTCKKGDSLVYKFEKYPSEVTDSQTIIVGYSLDGVLYPGEEFKGSSGTYQLNITKGGDYYIYVISATSDYLALKQGTISILNN